MKECCSCLHEFDNVVSQWGRMLGPFFLLNNQVKAPSERSVYDQVWILVLASNKMASRHSIENTILRFFSIVVHLVDETRTRIDIISTSLKTTVEPYRSTHWQERKYPVLLHGIYDSNCRFRLSSHDGDGICDQVSCQIKIRGGQIRSGHSTFLVRNESIRRQM